MIEQTDRRLVRGKLRLLAATALGGLVLSSPCVVIAQAASAPSAPPPSATPVEASPATVGEVIVTAQKRSENIQTVPLSVTALSSTAVANAHAVTIQGLNGVVPNVQINTFSNTPHSATLAIRGMSVIDPDPYAGNVVTVVEDGVPQYFDFTSLLDLFDVSRVEVLKGPQGTLFGANTIGGVINVVTNQPTGRFGGEAALSVGNYDRVNADVALNFPIVNDKLAGKIDIVHNQRSGYVTNVVNGKSMGSIDDTDVRSYLKWTPMREFDATLILEYDGGRDGSPVVVNGAYPGEALYVTPGTNSMYQQPCIPGRSCHAPSTYYSANNSTPNESNENTYSATLTANWRSPFGDVVSISNYKHARLTEYTDQDGTPEFLDDTLRPTNAWQGSQEVRDTFNPLNHVQVILGAFGIVDHYSLTQNYRIQFAAPGFSQITVENQYNQSGSLFGQTFVDLTSKMRLQAGLRYTYERTDMSSTVNGYDNCLSPTAPPDCVATYNGAPQISGFSVRKSKSWNNIGAKIGLDYRWTPTFMTYIYYARGFKSGGFVGRISIPSDIGPYSPEYVDTVEGGVKSQFFDRRLTFNASGFYNRYSDIQLAEIYFEKVNGVTVNGNSIINAAQADTHGFEIETSYVPINGLTLSASLAYLDATYTKFLYSDPNAGGALENLSGYDLQDSPPWSGSLEANYKFPLFKGQTTFDVQYLYTDRKYDYNLADTLRSKVQPTNYVNGNLDWSPDGASWTVGIWVKNIANSHDIASVYDAPGIFGLVNYAPPREFGGDFRYKW